MFKVENISGFPSNPLTSPRQTLGLNRANIGTQTDIAGLDDLLSWSQTYEHDTNSDSEVPVIIPEEASVLYVGTASFDVKKCMFCQGAEDKKGRTLITLSEDGIKSLEKALPEFKKLKSAGFVFPGLMVDERLLTDDPGQFLRSDTFKYHRHCRNKFNASELERAKKRKIVVPTDDADMTEEQQGSGPSDRNTRSSTSSSGAPKPFSKICMFCDEAEEVKFKPKYPQTHRFKLRAAASKNKDSKYAIKFTDDILNKAKMMILHNNLEHKDKYMLVAKLGTDVRASELYYHNHCLSAFNKR